MILNSIRIWLTLWYLGVLALIIAALCVFVYLSVARNLAQTIDENLNEIAHVVEADLHKEDADIAAEKLQQTLDEETKKPDEADEDEKTLKEEVLTIEGAIVEELNDLRFRDYGIVVLDGSGQQIGSTITDARLQNGLKNLSADVSFADLPIENETFRVCRLSLKLDGKSFQLLVIRSLREPTEFLDSLRKIFYIAVPLALLLAGLGGYFLARQSLAPVVSMSNQAAKISSTNLDERLPIKNERDELGGLAKVFNALLERLENSFAQQRRFMADASHELRTPLAIVRTEAEVALLKDDRTSAEYRESLNVIHDESKTLTHIVEDLFLLARADSGQLKPQFTTVYLDEMLTECVHAIRTLAEKRKVEIKISELAEMPLKADESLLHRLFLNLLDNAVKYNRENGTVSIAAETVGKNYRVTISDTGAGIAESDRAKIFERFYRVDKARSHDNTNGKNGVGLGLSIAAWIAEVHQGSLTLQKSDADGSVFRVELPRFAK